MPLLADIADEFREATPFSGLTIGVSLHLEPKTAVLLDALAAGGARVVATGNLGTTQPETVAALTGRGIEAFGSPDDDQATHLEHVAAVAAEDPHLLLDNGADLVAAVLSLGARPRGGTEETTSGAFRLRGEFAAAVPFPIIVINDSPLKAIVENKHAVGQSILESFMRITNLMIQGKRIVVVGYGWCGRGIAHYARALGGEVTVVEIDEIKALEAVVDGFRVAALEQVAPWGSVFITATGARRVIDTDTAAVMGDGAILANAGHFDTEIDVPALRRAATEVDEPAAGIECLRMPGGKALVLLAGGRMFNLAGPSPKGNSIESMDLGFALQARSLQRVATDPGSLLPGPQPIPDDINRSAAAAMVRTMMGS
jgi:adenosylhomocysteinase